MNFTQHCVSFRRCVSIVKETHGDDGRTEDDRVSERLADLVPLELLVLNSGLVLAHTLGHEQAVLG